MNKETFNTLMSKEDWEFIGKPDVSSEISTNQNEDWEARAKQNQYERGGCLIHITDEEIESMSETSFVKWFSEKSSSYYFKNDWKKAFKGSEFLIPVVEKEIIMSRHFCLQDIFGKILMVQRGGLKIESVIEEIEEVLNATHQK